MRNRVADHVPERLAKLLSHRHIQFSFFALDREPHALAFGGGQVAHSPMVLPKNRANRDHANLHHLLLEGCEDLIRRLVRLEKFTRRG